MLFGWMGDGIWLVVLVFASGASAGCTRHWLFAGYLFFIYIYTKYTESNACMHLASNTNDTKPNAARKSDYVIFFLSILWLSPARSLLLSHAIATGNSIAVD